MELPYFRASPVTSVQFPIMMASSTLASSFAPNLSGQLISRLISFAINMYLLRRINGDLLGVVNVSLTLFYTTTIFLVREPFRKTFLSNDVPLSRVVNYLWLSPLICPLVALSLYSLIWIPLSTVPPPELVDSYEWALFTFGFAAWLEAVAEPFVIISLRLAMDAQYAVAQGLLVVTQRITVVVFLFFTPMPHIAIFCYAQGRDKQLVNSRLFIPLYFDLLSIVVKRLLFVRKEIFFSYLQYIRNLYSRICQY
uniref:Protein RFT1 homolog n=1 Tax=Parascaris univalens TaxID=6257 RepID=A0A915CK22_PARUN